MKVPVSALAGILAFALISLAKTPPQSREVPYEFEMGPTWYEIALDFMYPKNYKEIKDVNFQDIELHIFNAHGRAVTVARLSHGEFASRNGFSSETIKLDSIQYQASGEPGREFALALLTQFFAGGSGNTQGIAQVFQLREQHLTLLQQIDWDEHFDWGRPYAAFDEESGMLVVRSTHYLPGDAHCCVSAMDVVTFRWKGGRFEKSATSVELTDYGSREGKKL